MICSMQAVRVCLPSQPHAMMDGPPSASKPTGMPHGPNSPANTTLPALHGMRHGAVLVRPACSHDCQLKGIRTCYRPVGDWWLASSHAVAEPPPFLATIWRDMQYTQL